MKKIMSQKGIGKIGAFGLPMPMAMVSMGDDETNYNIITVEMVGMLSVDPLMVYVSIRPERYSHGLIKQYNNLVINLVTNELAYEMDYCGSNSGRDKDKFKALNLTPVKGKSVAAPLIKESPLNYECQVEDVLNLGSHDVFICKVTGIQGDVGLIDEKDHLKIAAINALCAYEGFQYYDVGSPVAGFGFSKRVK